MPLQRDVKAALMEASRPLARSLGQITDGGPRRTLIVASDRDRIYTVHQFNGQYVCNCIGYSTGTTTECRHIKEAKMTTLPAVRQTTDIVPAGYEPLPLAPTNRLPSAEEFDMMKRIASTVFEGGDMVPSSIKTPQAALAVMLAGHELGMPPLASLRRIHIVNGKTELETQALMGLVRSGDPTARFVFHKYEINGADVELFREGVSVIRCAYTEIEKDLAKQGMRKRGEWKQSERGKNYFAPLKVNGVIQWEEDEDSPWHKFPRDMYAYNAVKRCCRLGAPDLTNQIGPVYVRDIPASEMERALMLPTIPLSAALAAGEIKPEAVFTDDGREVDAATGEILSGAPVEESTASEQNLPPSSPPANVGEGLVDPEDLPWDAAEAAEEQDGASTQQPATKRTPAQLLTAIGKKHGNGRALAARAIMPMHFGTMDPSKLTAEAAADYAALLEVWLNDPEHSHEAKYTADGRAVCGRCGIEVKEPEPAST